MRCLLSRRTLPRAIPAGLLLAAIVVTGCGSGGEEEATVGRLQVTATTPVVADLVRNVGGERVVVRQLLPAGADPHDHEPRPSDARAVAQSALVFQSGGDLDAWLGEVIGSGDDAGRSVSLLDTLPDNADAEAHWWHNPRNAVTATRAIAVALSDADPAGARFYRRGAAAYIGELERLDERIEQCLAGVPRRDRELVTTHDSFGAFAARYGIREVGSVLPGRSTHAQPSVGEITRLAERLERKDVRAVFPEPAVDPGLEQALAREAGAALGRPLWGDSLGPPGSTGATYLESMSSNALAMAEGFTDGERSCERLSDS